MRILQVFKKEIVLFQDWFNRKERNIVIISPGYDYYFVKGCWKKKRKKKKMRKDEQALMYFMGMRANTQARQPKPEFFHGIKSNLLVTL